MSAVRRYVDGKPVWVTADEGMTVRRTIGRYSTLGGSLAATPRVDLRTLFPATTPARRAQIAAYRARSLNVCGLAMTAGVCARKDGHRDAHRTAAFMEAQARRRRAA